MPDSPDRQVPPPPPEGGAVPIPDVTKRSGPVPRRSPGTRSSLSRPKPPVRPPQGGAVPAPPKESDEPASTDISEAESPQASRGSRRRQPLSGRGASPSASRLSGRERLQRLADQQGGANYLGLKRERGLAGDQARPAGLRSRPSTPSTPSQSEDGLDRPAESVASSPERPASGRSVPGRAVPGRAGSLLGKQSAAPVVPEPPKRRQAPPGTSRIPEPPARGTTPAPARRPANRILEALDAKLAADEAASAKAKAARRQGDEALRRIRPNLSSPRPAPPKAPTPSVTSSAPIAPRVPQAGVGGRSFIGVPTPLDDEDFEPLPPISDAGMPLPDPSMPPVPVIPLKPRTPISAEPSRLVDESLAASAHEADEDPLAASYERLVKAAKRQAALEAALAPDTKAEPDTGGVAESAPVPVAEPLAPEEASAPVVEVPVADAAQDELEQAKRDAERFFGPDDALTGQVPVVSVAHHPETEPPAEAELPANVVKTGETAVVEEVVGTTTPAGEDFTHAEVVGSGAVATPEPSVTPTSTEPAASVSPGETVDDTSDEILVAEEITPPSGFDAPVVDEVPDIEDAEIVPDAHLEAGDDMGGTIIATNLDLMASPETIDPVEPGDMDVDEATLDAMPVDEASIDEALASAPSRVVEEDATLTPPPLHEPHVEETPPQSRGFRALTAVLILIIFALVCIAAYRIMMRPGGGAVEPTPTPIVPTEQTARPSESASPSRGPKASEPTPVPALPPREPLPSDAAIPPALPGQSTTPEVMGGAGNVEIGQHTISLSRINDVNLPGLIDKPVAGENVQVQSVLGEGAHLWLGSDQDNRILAVVPEPFREALKDLQAGDRVDFIGTMGAADVPEILAPEQGRDRLIRQGAAIEVTGITVRK